MAKVVKSYTTNGTFVAPAGVTTAQIIATTNVPGINAAGNYTAIITAQGPTYMWGYNANGGLGNGNVTPQSSPVAVLGSLSFVTVTTDTASSSSGILANGTGYAWGLNANGQLGVGDVTPRSSPVAILESLTLQKIYQFNDGFGGYAFGLTTTGKLYSWGINTAGVFELGLGDSTPRSSPVAVAASLNFSQVTSAIAVLTSLALTTSGKLYAWGGGSNGSIGNGLNNSSSTPVAIAASLTFSQIYASKNSLYALSTSGQLYAWGSNTAGQLGVGDTVIRSTPTAVLGGLTFSQIAVCASDVGTDDTVLGLTTTGVAYAWGHNDAGQLGVGDTTPRSSPVAVLGGLSFSQLLSELNSAGGTGVSCFGLTTNGALYAWGGNGNSGALGVGDTTPRSSPVAVMGGNTFTKLLTSGQQGFANIIAIDNSGNLYSWGNNSFGNLGVGDTTNRSSPTLVLGALSPIVLNKTNVTQVTLVPGQSYSVNLASYNAFFGGNCVGSGNVSMIQVIYDQ